MDSSKWVGEVVWKKIKIEGITKPVDTKQFVWPKREENKLLEVNRVHLIDVGKIITHKPEWNEVLQRYDDPITKHVSFWVLDENHPNEDKYESRWKVLEPKNETVAEEKKEEEEEDEG